MSQTLAFIMRERNQEFAELMKWAKARADAIRSAECALCDHRLESLDEFDDRASFKEYLSSGLCQSCQNEVYGEK